MRNPVFSLLLATFALTTLSACDHDLDGDGDLVTRERDLGSVQGLEVDIPATVYVRQGSPAPIRMRGEENLLDAIEWVVTNDTLRLDEPEGIDFEPTLDLEIWVTLSEWQTLNLELDDDGAILTEVPLEVEVADLHLSGSGVIDAELHADFVATEVDGSGVVRLAGATRNLDVELSGSGAVAAYNLTSVDADVDVPGSGAVHVFVTDDLDIEISGSGSVYYKGDPRYVSVDVTGIGEAHSVE